MRGLGFAAGSAPASMVNVEMISTILAVLYVPEKAQLLRLERRKKIFRCCRLASILFEKPVRNDLLGKG